VAVFDQYKGNEVRTIQWRFHTFGVGIAQSAWLGAGRPALYSRQARGFLFSTVPRPALGPSQPLIQWVPKSRMVELYLHSPIRLRGSILSHSGALQVLGYFSNLDLSDILPVCPCVPLSLLGNGASSSTIGGIELWVQVLWRSRAADLLILTLGVDIPCFQNLPNTSNRTEERMPLLAKSLHINVYAWVSLNVLIRPTFPLW
jgi:hypothetical protein